MDLKFITHHLVSGCLPMTIVFILYSILIILLKKKHNIIHIITSFLFCIYLIGVFVVTGICLKGSFSPRISLIPFLDMIRGPKDTFLNIFMFIPLGLFLPILYKEFNKIGIIAIAGFLFSLSIEIIQMFGFGSSDINDLMTNTIGACLGYLIFVLISKIVPKSVWEKTRIEGAYCYFEPLFFWISCTIIMLTVQIPIFHLLFPPKIGNGELNVWK